MARKPTVTGSTRRHISVVVVPDSTVSTLFGIYDILAFVERQSQTSTGSAPFHVELVGEKKGLLSLASGVTVEVQRSIDTIDATDVMIVPSVDIGPDGWKKGRYPRVIDWVRRMHEGGTVLCSACLGIFLLAESGLFDGRDATVHFDAAGIFAATYPAIPIHPERVLMISGAREELVSSGASVAWHDLALHLIARYAGEFGASYPAVPIHPERVLVISGTREDLVSSGASTTWHDLVLYLIARFAGATDAQDVARMYALQWHQDGLAPYITFEGRLDHGDAEIAGAQRWLSTHFSVANPVEQMIQRSKLAERTFKRRFTAATGLAPIAYVQRLRIEEAKRRLERTDAPVDEISWRVGYEDAAFFRRLFRRTTGLAPGAYRKRFRIPEFARP